MTTLTIKVATQSTGYYSQAPFHLCTITSHWQCITCATATTWQGSELPVLLDRSALWCPCLIAHAQDDSVVILVYVALMCHVYSYHCVCRLPAGG